MLPIWSAAVDPRVLNVRALPLNSDVGANEGHPFDVRAWPHRIIATDRGEYAIICLPGETLRLDIEKGTLLKGPVYLKFELILGARLGAQLTALNNARQLKGGACNDVSRPSPLARLLLPLTAFDIRARGGSLRDIAQTLLGDGDWPGDGDHRKSRARRMVAMGEAMVAAGPSAILRESPLKP